MIDSVSPLAVFSWEELTTYVHRTLCQRENLLADQFPISEMPLCKAGRICGVQFTVYGPRQIRLSAIWAADQNVIYFYDTRGERYLKIPLRYRLNRAA